VDLPTVHLLLARALYRAPSEKRYTHQVAALPEASAGATVCIYATGMLLVTGAPSWEAGAQALEAVVHTLRLRAALFGRSCGLPPWREMELRPGSHFVQCRLHGHRIRLAEAAAAIGGTYEPEIFPGMHVSERGGEGGATTVATIFASGQIMLMGVASPHGGPDAARALLTLLRPFAVPSPPSPPSKRARESLGISGELSEEDEPPSSRRRFSPLPDLEA
jgi:TATA-box binding protein (TBP) (component of TFIID and TFIIIB)